MAIPFEHGHTYTAIGNDATTRLFAENLVTPDGWHDVLVHGGPNGFGVELTPGQWQKVSAREIVDIVKSNVNYNGEPIRLIACSPFGPADDLAAEFDTAVVHPELKVAVLNDGSISQLGARDIPTGDGHFVLAEPRDTVNPSRMARPAAGMTHESIAKEAAAIRAEFAARQNIGVLNYRDYRPPTVVAVKTSAAPATEQVIIRGGPGLGTAGTFGLAAAEFILPVLVQYGLDKLKAEQIADIIDRSSATEALNTAGAETERRMHDGAGGATGADAHTGGNAPLWLNVTVHIDRKTIEGDRGPIPAGYELGSVSEVETSGTRTSTGYSSGGPFGVQENYDGSLDFTISRPANAAAEAFEKDHDAGQHTGAQGASGSEDPEATEVRDTGLPTENNVTLDDGTPAHVTRDGSVYTYNVQLDKFVITVLPADADGTQQTLKPPLATSSDETTLKTPSSQDAQPPVVIDLGRQPETVIESPAPSRQPVATVNNLGEQPVTVIHASLGGMLEINDLPDAPRQPHAHDGHNTAPGHHGSQGQVEHLTAERDSSQRHGGDRPVSNATTTSVAAPADGVRLDRTVDTVHADGSVTHESPNKVVALTFFKDGTFSRTEHFPGEEPVTFTHRLEPGTTVLSVDVDRAIVWRDAAGNVQTHYRDDSLKMTRPDHSTTTWLHDGTRIDIHPDHSSDVYRPSDQSHTHTDPQGFSHTLFAGGESWSDDQGHGSARYDDGRTSQTQQHANGGRTTTWDDGTRVQTDRHGNSVTHNPHDGSITSREPARGQETTVYADKHWVERNASGGWTTHYPDGSKDVNRWAGGAAGEHLETIHFDSQGHVQATGFGHDTPRAEDLHHAAQNWDGRQAPRDASSAGPATRTPTQVQDGSAPGGTVSPASSAAAASIPPQLSVHLVAASRTERPDPTVQKGAAGSAGAAPVIGPPGQPAPLPNPDALADEDGPEVLELPDAEAPAPAAAHFSDAAPGSPAQGVQGDRDPNYTTADGRAVHVPAEVTADTPPAHVEPAANFSAVDGRGIHVAADGHPTNATPAAATQSPGTANFTGVDGQAVYVAPDAATNAPAPAAHPPGLVATTDDSAALSKAPPAVLDDAIVVASLPSPDAPASPDVSQVHLADDLGASAAGVASADHQAQAAQQNNSLAQQASAYHPVAATGNASHPVDHSSEDGVTA